MFGFTNVCDHRESLALKRYESEVIAAFIGVSTRTDGVLVVCAHCPNPTIHARFRRGRLIDWLEILGVSIEAHLNFRADVNRGMESMMALDVRAKYARSECVIDISGLNGTVWLID